jgi:hypothetical protein
MDLLSCILATVLATATLLLNGVFFLISLVFPSKKAAVRPNKSIVVVTGCDRLVPFATL